MPVVGGADDGVAHAVAAGVVVELGARGLPGRRPEFAGVVVAQVDVAPAEIERHVVVAVAREAAQAGVAIKGVAAGGVGDDSEIGLAAEVIDPGQRRVGLGDHVLAVVVVKISVLHPKPPIEGEGKSRSNVFPEHFLLLWKTNVDYTRCIANVNPYCRG